MSGSIFQTNPILLSDLLTNSHRGVIQLPDFQRSWVWDEERIKSLIASISRAFPIGALMSLSTGGPVNFKPRPIEGSPAEAKNVTPQSLILDGQQRITSMYQVTLRGKVVETITPKKKKVKRWFYIDIRKALDKNADREDAVVGVPEDRIVKKDFGREIDLDLSNPEKEYANLMFPVTQVFDWDKWQDGFDAYWSSDQTTKDQFRTFKKEVLEKFKMYSIPVITLDRETSKEAVCVVFEKVNTGGKPLDAFELVTAMYAASGHELRKDWFGDDHTQGRHRLFIDTLRPGGSDSGIIAGVSNTDFLQAVSLFYTREIRREAEKLGKQGKELPAISCNRSTILNLPLDAYKKYEKRVEQGFINAAKFLHTLYVFRTYDLPYQSQIVALASILADLGEAWEHDSNRDRLVRWYWNGVFGELYGSAIETRIARDFAEVPVWLSGGPEPSTITDTMFRPDRLKTMRMRLSAAYKGVNALLMKEGAIDFRSGQKFEHTVFFGENVDIHHIFPQDWCKKLGLDYRVYDSIINKTPLSYKTNRILGGTAPSAYISKLETGNSPNNSISGDKLDQFIASHLISPNLLRTDDFDGFMVDRQKQLLKLIERATGKPALSSNLSEEGEDVEFDSDTIEAELTLSTILS